MERTRSLIAPNRLLPVLLMLVGISAIIVAIVADLVVGDGRTGFGPNQLSLTLSGFAVLMTGVVLISSDENRIGEWLLVGAGVVAAAFAADLLVIGGLPGLQAKQMLVASVVFGLALVGVAPASSAGRRHLEDWLNLLAVDSGEVVKFASIVVQFGLLVLVVRQFELENQAFYHNLLLLTFSGFLIHYFLPAQYRLSFFLLLSLAAIVGIFGVVNGAWMIGIGLGLIALAHLPVSFVTRVALLIAAGVALVLLRMEWITTPIPGAIWPILGSLFMFRMIVYMYDVKHQKELSFDAPRTLSYFFLLPNIVFPLFPVVDFSTFKRTYYNDERHEIYQTGIDWMLRGVVQLIIYRFVNYYLVISPQDVAHAGDLVRYLVPNILLLIRVTGQFHLAIGILHLFGFNLPVTNDRYFLADGFTDFWRRANIYWKDFILKVFYYPAYFRLKNWGAMPRLAAATIFAFLITWALHSYQWFWLRGSFLLSAPDVLFWTFFGLLVLGNSLYEAKKGRKRTLGTRTWSFRETGMRSLRVLGTFATITILWSLWTSPSVSEFLSLWSAIDEPLGNLVELWPLVLVVVAVIGATFWYSRDAGLFSQSPKLVRSAVVSGATIALLFAASTPAVYTQIGGRPSEFLADLSQERLSDRDAELLLRGYYEDLVGINRFNTELWEVYTKRPSDWPLIQETEAARLRDDFYAIELVPSARINFHGAQFSTNEWGMRDQEYSQVPAPNTYRIVLLGPSFVMGSGVDDDKTFEALLEQRLNTEHGHDSLYEQYEILNFGVAGYSALQELAVLEHKAFSFQPNAIIMVGHQHEAEIAVRNLASQLRSGSDIPYPYLVEIGKKAGVDTTMTQVEAERRLTPYERDIVTWTYRQVVEVAEQNGVLPIWVFMPTLEASFAPELAADLKQIAKDAGFVTIDLSTIFDDQDVTTLIVAEWDKHPNAKGHQLIANRLYQALLNNSQTIPLGLTAGTAN